MSERNALDLPYGVSPDGLRLSVRLSPGASRARVGGVVVDAAGRPELRVWVNAPAVEGAANAALIAFLAKALRLRASDVSLIAGHTARSKRLLLSGDGEDLAKRLDTLIASGA